MPSSQSCELLQFGNHFREAPVAVAFPGDERGAAKANSRTVISPGTHHTSRSRRQLPSTAGNTTGMLSADTIVTPISMPLVETALASQARAGAQSRIRVGSAG